LAAVAPAEQERRERASLVAVAGVEVLTGGLLTEGQLALWIAGLGVVEEAGTILGARLEGVAAEGPGDGERRLVDSLLAVHDQPALGPDVEAPAAEERKGLVSGIVIEVLRQAEFGGVEVLKGAALVVRVDEAVIEDPDGGRVLDKCQVTRR